MQKVYTYKLNFQKSAESTDSEEDGEDSAFLDLDPFDQMLKQKGMPISESSDSTAQVIQRIQDFEKFKTSENDAISYWAKRQDSEPELYSLAMTVFQIPGSQVCVERNFSAWKWIFNDRRNNIDANLMDDIMLVHLNHKFNG